MNDNDREKQIRMPKKYNTWRDVQNYIEYDPDSEYQHASKEAYSIFKDMKFGVRIHWGIYSIWELAGESWPYLDMDGKTRLKYNNLYKNWNPIGFDADEWMSFFKRSGFKCFAFTTKHHEGFSMFDTKTRVKKRVDYTVDIVPKDDGSDEVVFEDCDLAYSIMETPFKRDIVKELCDAARKHDIKIDLYFSHPDWYDADFRPYGYHPLITEEVLDAPQDYCQNLISVFSGRNLSMSSLPSFEERERMLKRHRDQIFEILSNYGKIDMMCLDIAFGPETWPYLKETIKMARKIQPDIMFRSRGIGNYGDYYTPEGYVPGDPNNTEMPWMVIYPLGSSFSYEKETEKHKGTLWIIKNLVDTVAKGGNFMVGIGPDGSGRFHEEAIRELEEAGEWLKINGEGIYGTRMWKIWKQGEDVRICCNKERNILYIFTFNSPKNIITIESVNPQKDSQIFLLGNKTPLNWNFNDNKLFIEIPKSLEENLPCKWAWCFKVSI